MRLAARVRTRVRIPGARLELRLRAGEEIRTEISCKYTRETFAGLLQGTGFSLARWDTDTGNLFALALLRRDP